jgi:uncharacterized membrane protein
VDSVDLLRGLVMVIMALDHVRDFFHADAQLFSPEDLTRTNGMLFFTRWITHFCAPVFVFLAGVSVHFLAPRRVSRSAVSRFLVTRGVWLIFLEWAVMPVAFSFNFSYRLVLVQVLWALGWSMIVLAGLIWLPRAWILTLALGMIAFHNAFDSVTAASFGNWGWLWSVLHAPSLFSAGGRQFFFLYPLIPWVGVMAAGYCLGPVIQMEAARRRRILFGLGTALTLAFLVLRWLNIYGDARRWAAQGDSVLTIVSFFNTTKYPPSLLYLLMTLGPALLVLALLDRVRVGSQNFFRVFGRVPMFYYLVHFFSIHALAVLLGGLRFGRWDFLFQFPGALLGLPAGDFPQNYGYNLAVVYLIWISLACAFYFPCRWYMNFHSRKHAAWLSYL